MDVNAETNNGKKFAAFLCVTLSALSVSLFGIAGFIALVPAFAATVAALDTPLRFLYFIPGAAVSVGICFAFDSSPAICAVQIGCAVVCGFALGAALKRRASATAQSVTTAVTVYLLAAAAGIIVSLSFFGSIPDALRAAYNYAVEIFKEMMSVFESAAKHYAEIDPNAAAALDLSAYSAIDSDEAVRTVMFRLPGIFAAAAFVFGWVSQLLSRLFLLIIGRRDMITEVRRLKSPLSLAIIFFVLRLITFFISGESVFFLSSANVVTALYPFMIIIGAGYLIDIVRKTKNRFSIMILIMFSISALILPSVFIPVLSVAGVIGTVVDAVKNKMETDR